MSSNILDTAVRKATRLDYLPPKQKHVNTLIALTFQYPASIKDIVDTLEHRHNENSWIITFKVLIILHTLMRQGHGDGAIESIDARPSAIDSSRLREKSSGIVQIENIYCYADYLQQKVLAFRSTRTDHVKSTMTNKVGKLRHLTVKDGLLHEVVVVQKQIGALLKCDFRFDDGESGISLNAYRLLIEDLLILFQTVNEAIVNILEHYFAMSKPNARLSLEVYKRFAKQTEQMVAFLNHAKILESALGMTIPVTRHAPLSLASALEEYLRDAPQEQPTTPQQTQPARQVQQQQQQAFTPIPQQAAPAPEPASSASSSVARQPQELIDFFASIENEHTTIPVVPDMTGQHNPFRSTMMQQPSSPLPDFMAPASMATSSTNTMPIFPPQPSPSTSSNPFRTTTPQPQQNLSTPTFQNLQVQLTGIPTPPSPLSMAQQPRQQQPLGHTSFNPFAAPQSSSSNPFLI
ncbi:ANTH domain-domain-containing protein [Syncephalastrum racemosum]|uniref:ANTH domain-domain-containing protein n=1 Tax=Syncephalastrum racemosum TaxID=13706 RepID=A0A1X2HHR5_SYNRA|nr:ANTH domain-domain-containing protein [Syncephalastrum racemosum]